MTATDAHPARLAVWCDLLAQVTSTDDAVTLGVEAVSYGWAMRQVNCTRPGCVGLGTPPMTTTGAVAHMRESLRAGIAHGPGDLVPVEYPDGVPNPPPRVPDQLPKPRWRVSWCSSCGAPIYWANTTRGSRMPVDTVPTADGNLVLADAPGHDGTPIALGGPEVATAPVRYRAHFSTCPNAARHRKGRSR